MTIRAKFTCNSIIPQEYGDQKTVTFSAVTNGCEENKSFSRWTPSELVMRYPQQQHLFKVSLII